MVNVGIVILNWNREKETIQCLNSVDNLLVKNFESKIFLVDNGSKSEDIRNLKRYIKQKKGKNEIILIENGKNLGFCGGNNVGIQKALDQACDFILILNNDTFVDPQLIVQLIEASKNKSDGGIFSPLIYFSPGYEFHKNLYKNSQLGKVIWYAGGEIDWKNVYGINRGVDEVDIGQYNKIEEIDFATGACMFVRSEVFRRIGAFDDKYFMYLEDVDFSCRAKKANWKVFFIPTARIWHKVAQSSAIGSQLNDYFITRNRLLFGLRYAPFRSKIALFKESVRIYFSGREWQRKGVVDFYLQRFGKGSWK